MSIDMANDTLHGNSEENTFGYFERKNYIFPLKIKDFREGVLLLKNNAIRGILMVYSINFALSFFGV